MVLYFNKTKKTLPLNRVNWDSVADILGDDTDDWIGGKIELYPTTTEMAGKTVPCVRVRQTNGALPLKKAARRRRSRRRRPTTTSATRSR